MFDINLILVISISILAFFSFCILLIIIPLGIQFYKTLSSTQQILDLINDELKPTVREIKEGIGSVKSVVKSGTSIAKTGLQETSILLTSSAYGILAAIKDYLKSCKKGETSYNNKR